MQNTRTENTIMLIVAVFLDKANSTAIAKTFSTELDLSSFLSGPYGVGLQVVSKRTERISIAGEK